MSRNLENLLTLILGWWVTIALFISCPIWLLPFLVYRYWQNKADERWRKEHRERIYGAQ